MGAAARVFVCVNANSISSMRVEASVYDGGQDIVNAELSGTSSRHDTLAPLAYFSALSVPTRLGVKSVRSTGSRLVPPTLKTPPSLCGLQGWRAGWLACCSCVVQRRRRMSRAGVHACVCTWTQQLRCSCDRVHAYVIRHTVHVCTARRCTIT